MLARSMGGLVFALRAEGTNVDSVTLGHNVRAIFAIKLKLLRESRHLTLAELAHKAGLSTSYLAEIEGGKKYPKPERILHLAQALECPYDELTSTKLGADFSALQAFVNSPVVRSFPFERFGVPVGDLMKLLTRSPAEIQALLRTVTYIARQYDMGVEHFLHAALRSYQEETGNYYEDLERAAEALGCSLPSAANGGSMLTSLRHWMTANCGCEIDERLLGDRVALKSLRAVRVVDSHPRVLLNRALTDPEKAFVLAREAGYHVLGLKARSLTTPPDRDDSFEQVLSDFKASYFAGALLLPRKAISAEIKAFFRVSTWQPEILFRLLEKYQVTPQALIHRFSQIVPSQFGLGVHFLKFSNEAGRLQLVEHLNLSDLPFLPGARTHEHHCQRWLSIRLAVDFTKWQQRQVKKQMFPVAAAQHSKMTDGDDTFFCIGMALPQPLRPVVVTSLTLGFKSDDKLFKTVRFAKDRTIPHTLVGSTCERCSLPSEVCSDRVAPPVLHLQALARADQERALEALRSRN